MQQKSHPHKELLLKLISMDPHGRDVSPEIRETIANRIAHGQVNASTHTTPTVASRVATQYYKIMRRAGQKGASIKPTHTPLQGFHPRMPISAKRRR